jgi:uncharacterized protein
MRDDSCGRTLGRNLHSIGRARAERAPVRPGGDAQHPTGPAGAGSVLLAFFLATGPAWGQTSSLARERRQCERGIPASCEEVGIRYEDGEGIPVNLKQAAAYYRLACDGGSAAGCRDLGLLLEDGRGVRKDLAAARELYQRACSGVGPERDRDREPEGCNDLGLLYDEGKGVAEDDVQAAAFFRLACAGESVTGCFNLALMYEAGLGITQDLHEARVLFQQGCDDDYEPACEGLDRLSPKPKASPVPARPRRRPPASPVAHH